MKEQCQKCKKEFQEHDERVFIDSKSACLSCLKGWFDSLVEDVPQAIPENVVKLTEEQHKDIINDLFLNNSYLTVKVERLELQFKGMLNMIKCRYGKEFEDLQKSPPGGRS